MPRFRIFELRFDEEFKKIHRAGADGEVISRNLEEDLLADPALEDGLRFEYYTIDSSIAVAALSFAHLFEASLSGFLFAFLQGYDCAGTRSRHADMI